MNFFETLENIINEATTTENGGFCYSSTGSKALDFFASIGGMRSRSEEDIIRMYLAARAENEEIADKIVLYSRSIRGKDCLGERKIGRLLLKTLACIEPEKVRNNLDLIVENGRFDDIYELEGTPVEPEMWYYIQSIFNNDVLAMRAGQNITLAAKWMKSINTSSEESRRLARKFCALTRMTERNYRKTLSALRKYLDVVEVKMSARQWEKIDFSKVPAKAMNMYSRAFHNQVPERISDYYEKLKRGEAKINASVLYPYEILEKVVPYAQMYRKPDEDDKIQLGLLEEAWKALPNYFDQPHNIVCCADVSGSMYGRPMATSIGLSLYCAERNQGVYNGLYLTFTDKPTFLKVDKNTPLVEKVTAAFDHVGYNTNLDGMYEAIYNLTCSTGESPECLVVISDGEIDRFCRNGVCESLLMKWERKFAQAGYKIPKTIMWNVEARENHYIDKSSNPNISFVSGSSAGIFSNVVNLKDYDAYGAMVKVLEPYEWK